MRTIAALSIAFLSSISCNAQQPIGMVQPIVVSDFMKLPEKVQFFYVSGIIEGMAFTLYGYRPDEYQSWATCVRSQTLGNTVRDVTAFIRQTPSFDEGVSSALAQTLGKRCKH